MSVITKKAQQKFQYKEQLTESLGLKYSYLVYIK